ncbi:Glutamine synthetase and cystathionine beta-lyase binding protein [subsurface metagenome]
MANYVVLMKMTPEGAKNLKDAPKRLAKYNEILAAEGAKITAAYATLGQYDFVAVIEGPEDFATVAKCSAAISMLGALSTQTMPAMPVTDFFKVVAEI